MDNHNITGLRSLFSGSYSFSSASNGYGTLSVTSGLGSTKSLGIYATDPTLNLNDPNSATGEGGDLVLDLSLLSPRSSRWRNGSLDSADRHCHCQLRRQLCRRMAELQHLHQLQLLRV